MTKRYSAGPPRTFSPENLIKGNLYQYTFRALGDLEKDEGRFLRMEMDKLSKRLWLWFRHYDGPKNRRTYDSPVACCDIRTITEMDD